MILSSHNIQPKNLQSWRRAQDAPCGAGADRIRVAGARGGAQAFRVPVRAAGSQGLHRHRRARPRAALCRGAPQRRRRARAAQHKQRGRDRGRRWNPRAARAPGRRSRVAACRVRLGHWRAADQARARDGHPEVRGREMARTLFCLVFCFVLFCLCSELN
jgi:site-specific DNA-cytosine methylase